jgi:hypothetical protein
MESNFTADLAGYDARVADSGLTSATTQGRGGHGTHVWLNLQTSYDLEVESDRLGASLARDVEVLRRTG